ncbi:cytochrome c biogenesis protein DipZ [uncultured Friedmanniella sp.]|uniref:cytochrome c biogenesis protein DipZ n=1 Tax=uncultured Friedmanniella sp. TaxID=335381 RepID=UPI0035C9A8E2
MLTLALLGLVGGLITGVSPCVLPMLPIIFFAGGTAKGKAPEKVAEPERDLVAAGSGGASTTVAAEPSVVETLDVGEPRPTKEPRKPRRNVRPLIIIGGLVTSFSVFTLLGSTILSALGLPQDLLRWVGLSVLALVGLGLIVPALGHLIEKPFYKLPQVANQDSSAFVFGLGLGTLYVPCAGPILAAITVAGASGRIGWGTVVLTVTFAVGAALPLLLFAAAGSKIQTRINAYRARAQMFRIVGGVVMIALAIALAFNVTAVLQRAVPAYTGGVEKKLAESKTVQGALSPFDNGQNKDLAKCTPGDDKLASCGTAPALTGTQQWFNTADDKPVALSDLKGKVVLIDFFAYSCINCQRDAPYIKSWYSAYQADGFEVIGVHSPEFAFEKSAGNLKSAITQEGITYPVVQDNDLKTWTAYRNRYWPAKYLIDAQGTVRAINFGEGNYLQTEDLIRQLLTEKSPGAALPAPVTDISKEQQTTPADQRTQEMYLSPGRTQTGYAGTPTVADGRKKYTLNDNPPINTYSYGGTWTGENTDMSAGEGAQIRLHYHAANVYNVLEGEGTVTVSQPGVADREIKVSGTPNLYPLVEGDDAVDQTITLTYSKGIKAFTYTFG